jgi:outer membrane protein OmpA-like peptidoglycan-associated protein
VKLLDSATRLGRNLWVALFAWLLGATFGTIANTADATIPLCPGLTIVTAVNQPEGDYESIKTIQAVTPTEVTLKYSNETVENRVITKFTATRTMLRKDLGAATLYQHRFSNRGAVTIPGTTSIGTSTAVLRALKARGEAQLGIFEATALWTPVDRNAHPNMYDYQMVETLRRAGAQPVMIPLTVNDAKVQLPAIEAKTDYTGEKADFFFLDDENNPLALRYVIGRDTLNVVKISYQCAAGATMTEADVTSAEADRLEQTLLKDRRAKVYTIYFSFNSDQLREESTPTLKTIAEVMRRHPDWNLAIEGHTDSIATDAYNLDLSKRRAAAVREALITRHAVSGGRLMTDGYGESRPVDSNDTLEGRARNRRVELVRVS